MNVLTNIICLASRSFPLGLIFVLIALTSCGPWPPSPSGAYPNFPTQTCQLSLTLPGTGVVFNILGPDCTYDRSNAYYMIHKLPGRYGRPYSSEMAVRFTAMTSGNLATVYLGLTNSPSKDNREFGGPVNVFLCGDVAGQLNIATQTYLGGVAPTGVYETTNTSVLSLVGWKGNSG